MKQSEHPRGRQRGYGFSLIELLAAVAVLMVMVMLMGMIFTAASQSWRVGADQAERNAIGRAAIDKIADDLQYAVADDLLSFVIRPDKNGLTPYGSTADEICFVSLKHDSHDGQRTARELFYYMRPDKDRPGLYNLVMGYYGKSIADNPGRHCYSAYALHNREWYDVAGRPGGTPQLVAENVAGLAFFAAATNSASSLLTTRDYESRARHNELPLYVDIYLELLEGGAARQLSQLLANSAFPPESSEVETLVERHLRRYTRRVYFKNRNGYRHRLARP